VAFIAAPPFGVATSILVFFLFSSTTFSEVCMFVVFGVVWLRLGAALWVTREVQAA
jgi:hypothetical protein